MRHLSIQAVLVVCAVAIGLTGSALAQTPDRDGELAEDDGRARDGSAFTSWTLQLAAGAGVGARELELPADGVVYVTRTGLFPAIDLAFELDHHASRAFRVGLHARYQTSLGLRIAERHSGGSERVQRLRSHRLELALVPALKLDGAGRWTLLAQLGCGTVDLRPETHVFTPGYFLAGPFLRAELQLPLGPDGLRLRLGPEAQWIALVGDELPHRGIDSNGFGLGGAAVIELQLGERWLVDASYRELRVWLDSSQPESLVDVSRFITARLTGML